MMHDYIVHGYTLEQAIRTDGPQQDASYSELHAAMVEALWRARKELDFSTLPLRGHWGNPSATMFVESLASAVAIAIVKHGSQG